MSLPRELFAFEGADGRPGALILRCTACGGELVWFEDERFLLCPTSRLRFRITEDDIPVMLLEEAERLEPGEIAALLGQARKRGLTVPGV
jgi:uncharacterized protein YbaR (Trm112 family)